MRMILKRALGWLSALWPGFFQTKLLAPPDAPDALEDIPDGEPNLLPLSILGQPLKITVPMWPISNPTPATPEMLRLYWNDALVDEKRWEAPIAEADLFVEAPVSVLQHGRAEVSYEVQGFNSVITPSQVLIVTIDKVPPVLGSAEGLLLFDEAVLREGLTARYLEQHEDVVLAELPPYDAPAVGDVITLYWDDKPFANDRLSERIVTRQDLDKTIYLSIPGDDVRARGDGQRYVHYQIRDRAGNLSARSRPAVLEVDATPIPRSLPWIEVPQAVGAEGDLSMRLDDYADPLVVIVPADAVIYPDERITVQWGAPGDHGYYTSSEPQPGTNDRFLIPEPNVLAYSKRTLEVRYVVNDGKQDFASVPCSLKVIEFATGGLPRVALEGANSSGFSLGSAPQQVPVSLGTWRGIAVGQRVNITVTGVLQSGADARPYNVLTAHAVTQAQVRQGIGANKEVTLPRAYLETLRRGEAFTFHVQVSFDGGTTWVDFPLYSPKLIP
ncbi:hypothetical protein VXM67_09160 [Pseudomonas sp. Rh2]|uniref:Ig-like domain-containing protein n=1 Tax=Pseudomonas taiwanensis TaxID=470150 RepID=A0ABR6V950_9PSED|nr:hypothetical protein [Pseudomonas taiwanensis]MBC3476392.1 hypothetical protein [Pseudomonas taiwanensis]MBC3492388.1 hypothetical protein [Pseudomonas taiwanensis]